MAITIKLKNKIDNDSLQVGDDAYYVTPGAAIDGINHSTEDPIKIGEITEIDSDVGGVGLITVETVNSTPSIDDFIMFQKNRRVNNTSLLGYYAEVKLNNNSEDKAELFALSSEITASSK